MIRLLFNIYIVCSFYNLSIFNESKGTNTSENNEYEEMRLHQRFLSLLDEMEDYLRPISTELEMYLR